MTEVVIGRRVETLRILTAANNAMNFKINLYQRGSTPRSPLPLTGFTFALRMEDGEEWVGVPNISQGSVQFLIPAYALDKPIGTRYRGVLTAANGGDEAIVFRVIVEVQ